MTLRRAVLGQIFDRWLQDVAQVFFGRQIGCLFNEER
jgi:hypothetical protein